MKKMNVYERVRLYLFTWLNDTYTHTYRFIYIYLTYAFGFDWTVGNISHGIKRIVMRQARV